MISHRIFYQKPSGFFLHPRNCIVFLEIHSEHSHSWRTERFTRKTGFHQIVRVYCMAFSYEAGGSLRWIFVHESIVLELLTLSLLVLASIVRFLPFSHRWTRAGLYFPKHRELLKTLRQVWRCIDFPAAQCHRPGHFGS